ncbi:MAG: 50S ribosomal protein L25 [Candidatus Omnitrophica bacterium]|nr:50S ribosomal protein L25 [Candidatus Omnitrophota bacterium]
MEQIKLKATLRESAGKEAAKKARNSGLVPGIVYHRGEKPISVSVNDRELNRLVGAGSGENQLISLEIDNAPKKQRAVIIKEIQHDPVKQTILHVDFNEISLTEKIQVEVALVAVGEPIGVKQDGGMLDHPLRELRIECLPMDIPKHIDVDVSGLQLNQGIHVSDLKLGDKLRVLNSPDTLLFQVRKHEEKVEEVAAATPELEVIREKKEEEGADKKAAPAKEEPKAKDAK